MLRILLVVLLLIVPQQTLSQNASIGLYTDAAGSSCSFSDTGGLLAFYVVMTGAPVVNAVEFAAPMPDCMTGATWIGDTRPFNVNIGNSQDGIVTAFGGAQATPLHVLTINYFTVGTSSTCCEYRLLPHFEEQVAWADASLATVFGNALVSIVNPDAGCPPCGFGEADPSFPFDPSPVGGGINPFPANSILQWNATDPQGDALTYDVYLTQVSGPGPLMLVASNISQNFFDPGLPNLNSLVRWRIVVRDSNGNESGGPIWTFAILGTVPVEEQSWGATKWGFSNDNKK